jgi:hypothetical protein
MSKATATLKISFSAGDCIEGAFEESIRLAKLLNIWVEFNFNGVTCISGQNGVVQTGIDSYRSELSRKDSSKVAFS